MREVFADARAQAPCLLFIDEIDSFLDRARVTHYPWTRPSILWSPDRGFAAQGVERLALAPDRIKLSR